ncbi:MAG: hypothetical protein WBX14_15395 [Candidatus Udaeobacter sp.]
MTRGKVAIITGGDSGTGVSNKYFLLFLHDKGSHETFEKRRCNHQHNLGHCLQRQSASARLLFDEGSDNILYPVTLAGAG